MDEIADSDSGKGTMGEIPDTHQEQATAAAAAAAAAAALAAHAATAAAQADQVVDMPAVQNGRPATIVDMVQLWFRQDGATAAAAKRAEKE